MILSLVVYSSNNKQVLFVVIAAHVAEIEAQRMGEKEFRSPCTFGRHLPQTMLPLASWVK